MQVSRRRQLLAVAALLTAISATAVALRRRREPARPADDETARVRELYEREATRYDSMIRIPERLLFVDGRIWAASHAVGDVLEIAVGTGGTSHTTGRTCASQDRTSAARSSTSLESVRGH